ncbi:MAG: hypothetical protein J7M19_08530 [Planctomycetes bacterium]|nr:hypothetical protein [Planctomycetota bacterium]
MLEKLTDYRLWAVTLVVIVLAAGCQWVAKLPPKVARPILAVGEGTADVTATIAEEGGEKAKEIAADSWDPLTKVSGWLAAWLLGGVATLLRKAQSDTRKANELLTEKIEKHDDGRIKQAIAGAMATASTGVKAAIETARP